MYCKTCEYPLWNLTAQTCPECGDPFRPSDFEFVPGTVEFCCQYCGQPYYGTTPEGHLEPREFACVKCGAMVDMDEMVLRPATGVADGETTPHRNPWLERQKIGRTKAWFTSVFQSCFRPLQFMRTLPDSSSIGQAWLFLLVTTVLVTLAGVVGSGLVLGMFGFLAAGGPGNRGMGGMMFFLPILGGAMLFLAVMHFVGVAIWGLVTHGLLKITGGSALTIKRTYEALCYSCGPAIIYFIPCVGLQCGYYIVPVWWCVSAILMVYAGQRVHGGRAALSVLTLPLLGILAFIAMYVSLFAAIGAFGGPGGGWNTTADGQFEADLIGEAIVAHAGDNGGEPPTHVIELVHDGSLSTYDFVLPQTLTLPEEVPVGDIMVADFEYQTPRLQREIVQELVDDHTENIVAYRLGDFVFTYPGMNLESAPPNLWIAVGVEASSFNAGVVPIVDVSGRVTTVSSGRLQQRIREQNVARRAAGLPPLPLDLASIQEDSPVTSEQAEQ